MYFTLVTDTVESLQKTIVQKRIEKGGVWGGRWV
jgi:hypothetical protein